MGWIIDFMQEYTCYVNKFTLIMCKVESVQSSGSMFSTVTLQLAGSGACRLTRVSWWVDGWINLFYAVLNLRPLWFLWLPLNATIPHRVSLLIMSPNVIPSGILRTVHYAKSPFKKLC